jgi:hypothetical protein
MRKVTGFGLGLTLLAMWAAVSGVPENVAAVASQPPQGTVTTGEVSGTSHACSSLVPTSMEETIL